MRRPLVCPLPHIVFFVATAWAQCATWSLLVVFQGTLLIALLFLVAIACSRPAPGFSNNLQRFLLLCCVISSYYLIWILLSLWVVSNSLLLGELQPVLSKVDYSAIGNTIGEFAVHYSFLGAALLPAILAVGVLRSLRLNNKASLAHFLLPEPGVKGCFLKTIHHCIYSLHMAAKTIWVFTIGSLVCFGMYYGFINITELPPVGSWSFYDLLAICATFLVIKRWLGKLLGYAVRQRYSLGIILITFCVVAGVLLTVFYMLVVSFLDAMLISAIADRTPAGILLGLLPAQSLPNKFVVLVLAVPVLGSIELSTMIAAYVRRHSHTIAEMIIACLVLPGGIAIGLYLNNVSCSALFGYLRDLATAPSFAISSAVAAAVVLYLVHQRFYNILDWAYGFMPAPAGEKKRSLRPFLVRFLPYIVLVQGAYIFFGWVAILLLTSAMLIIISLLSLLTAIKYIILMEKQHATSL